MACILIMDDDPAFRDGLRETLEDLGHAVLQAGSAREGLALMRRTPPDAVFLDYRMPDADGLSILRTLREQGPSPAPPVVMLTALP